MADLLHIDIDLPFVLIAQTDDYLLELDRGIRECFEVCIYASACSICIIMQVFC
jgi:hypothetical protein